LKSFNFLNDSIISFVIQSTIDSDELCNRPPACKAGGFGQAGYAGRAADGN